MGGLYKGLLSRRMYCICDMHQTYLGNNRAVVNGFSGFFSQDPLRKTKLGNENSASICQF